MNENNKIENIEDKEVVSMQNNENNFVEIFEYSSIPESILAKMVGKSLPQNYNNLIDIKTLAYVKVSYWGFDNQPHVGELVINKKLAQEVIDIFKEVYDNKYAIEKIKLIDEYNANDEKSMEDNNSSAFCYRVVANTKVLSNHAKGTAIDINPLYNPYIVNNYISPNGSEKYKNRKLNTKGIIKKGDILYNAFIKRGWTWGGEWKTKKDYQHFEKSVQK